MSMLFQNEKLVVRQLEEKDQFLLAKWLSDPKVLEFYEGRDNPFSLEKVQNKFFSSDGQTSMCMVEYEGKEIGYIQFYELDEETKKEYGVYTENTYGTDLFIGETDYWNQGIGTLLISTMVTYLIEHKKASRIVMDPQTQNTRAITCYEKCGFKKLKLLPNQEFHEGKYQDCWLMEYQK